MQVDARESTKFAAGLAHIIILAIENMTHFRLYELFALPRATEEILPHYEIIRFTCRLRAVLIEFHDLAYF